MGKIDRALQQLLQMDLETKGSKAEISLLWQNASPASAFANQKISLDLSGYGMVMVICNPGTGMAIGNQVGSGIVYARFFRAQKDYVQFDDCTAAAAVIPKYIYGVKL